MLDYVVTSNHVHVLVWVPRLVDLSAMMGWLQGSFAGDYNRRLRREGAFWRGRFHPTLIEGGRHLSRCLFYLDMNRVRAGVGAHPREWRFGGYQELSGARKRYRIIDLDRLLGLLGSSDVAGFRRWHAATLGELCDRREQQRETHWSRAFAVGSRRWLRELSLGRVQMEEYIEPVGGEGAGAPDAACMLSPPQLEYMRLLQAIAGQKRR